MDYLSGLMGPTAGGYDDGLYGFGYSTSSQPPARAATTASQIESGGSGFNWSGFGNTVLDITKAYMQVEAVKSSRPEAPVTYRTNEQGETYTSGNGQGVQTLGGVGSAIGGIPTAWLLIGGLIFAAVILSKEGG